MNVRSSIFLFVVLVLFVLPKSQAQEMAVQIGDSVAVDSLDSDSLLTFLGPTLLRIGSDNLGEANYGHFGDVLRLFPGIFVQDRGSVGQPFGFWMSGTPYRHVGLYLDGLDLRDPISGAVDLNLIPVTCLRDVVIQNYKYLSNFPRPFASTAILSTSLEHTGVKPLSRVMYRHGDYGYSDIDVNMSMKIRERSDIVLGGLLKKFDGVFSHEQYEAQKIRGKATMQISEHWNFRYSMLLNKSETHYRLAEYEQVAYPESQPSRKSNRFDHGIFMHGNSILDQKLNVQFSLTHTNLKREVRNNPLGISYDDNVQVFNTSVNMRYPLKQIQLFSGGRMRYLAVDSGSFGKVNEYELEVFVGGQLNFLQILTIETGMSAHTYKDFSSRLQPSIQVELMLGEHATLYSNYSSNTRFPNLEERLFTLGTAMCNSELNEEVIQSINVGFEFLNSWATWYLVGFWRSLDNRIDPAWSDEQDIWLLVNKNQQDYMGVQTSLNAFLLPQFQVKGNFYWQNLNRENVEVFDVPEWGGYLYMNWTEEFFLQDLELSVRPYCRLLGSRYGCSRFLGEADYEVTKLNAVIIPGIQFFGTIMKGAVIFVAFDNMFDTKYQQLFGYPMPGKTFRWGIHWHFVD